MCCNWELSMLLPDSLVKLHICQNVQWHLSERTTCDIKRKWSCHTGGLSRQNNFAWILMVSRNFHCCKMVFSDRAVFPGRFYTMAWVHCTAICVWAFSGEVSIEKRHIVEAHHLLEWSWTFQLIRTCGVTKKFDGWKRGIVMAGGTCVTLVIGAYLIFRSGLPHWRAIYFKCKGSEFPC